MPEPTLALLDVNRDRDNSTSSSDNTRNPLVWFLVFCFSAVTFFLVYTQQFLLIFLICLVFLLTTEFRGMVVGLLLVGLYLGLLIVLIFLSGSNSICGLRIVIFLLLLFIGPKLFMAIFNGTIWLQEKVPYYILTFITRIYTRIYKSIGNRFSLPDPCRKLTYELSDQLVSTRTLGGVLIESQDKSWPRLYEVLARSNASGSHFTLQINSFLSTWNTDAKSTWNTDAKAKVRLQQRKFAAEMLEHSFNDFKGTPLENFATNWYRRLSLNRRTRNTKDQVRSYRRVCLWLQTVAAREEGRLPVWEGIRIVRERSQINTD